MRQNTIKWTGVRNAIGAGGIALLLAGAPCLAQSAKVAAGSVEFKPDAAKKELAVGFRLVDAVEVTSVETTAAGKTESIPSTWEAWVGDKAPACAWLIVVDTSNPKRAKTVSACVEDVRSFLVSLPKQDSLSVCSLALNLVEAVPFGSAPEDVSKALTAIKADGDASKTTLIFTNLREGLSRLAERKEARKALLLLTDGKDETPGGAAAKEIEKNKLIEAANKAGIAIHTFGYAETLPDQAEFASLKEISSQTDGIHRGASVTSKELPAGIHKLLQGAMHGAGVAHIDLKNLKEPSALTLTVKTADGKTATLQVPNEKVVAAAPAVVTPPAPGATAEEIAKKAEEDKKKAADAAAEKEKADKAAADAAVAKKKAEATKKAEEEKKRLWIGLGAGGVLALLLAAFLMMRASRKRAEEEARIAEEARQAEEARADQETRRAEAARRSEETKKTEAPPLAWLEMCDAQQTRHPIRIPNLKIGRGQHNDFVLRNDSISGNHCVLDRNREGEWSITDLNSGNGVVVNGTLVKQAALRQGDTIELGELKMRFLLRA
jgi:hypothetical protein